MLHSAVLDDANDTELYQMCRRAGIVVTPGIKREDMIALLLGEAPFHLPNPIDEWRIGISAFVLDHWSVLRSQISCPAEQLGRLLEDEQGEPLPRKQVIEVLASGAWMKTVADRSAPQSCFRCIDQQVIACLVSNGPNERLIQLLKKPVPTEITTTMTTTPATTLTPESAPRSAEDLVKQGRFQIRRLASKLGMFANAEGVEQDGLLQAFLQLQPEVQAQQVSVALAQWDAANGGGKAPAVAAVPAPVAAPAAPAPTAPPKRSPRTSATAAAPVEAVETTNPGKPVAVAVDLTPVLARLDELTKEVATLKAMQAQGQATLQAHAAADSALSVETSKLILGYLMLFGESVLGGSREEIMEAATGDGGALVAAIQQRVAAELRKK